jgi:ferredoxin-NADP reductase
MSLLDRLARQVMKPATIETMQRIAAHTYRLSLGGPALADWAYVPGQTLTVFLSTRAEAASLRKRTYSIWG